MKTLLVRLLGCILLIAAPGAPAGAQIVVKLGTIAPEGSVWSDAILRIGQAWRKASGGRVELRVYAGGVLGGEDELVRKLQRRAIDAVTLSGSGLPAIDRSFDCLNIPLLFESTDELDHVRDRVAPAIERRIEKKGFLVLTWAIAGWVHIFSKDPIRVPADLRRQRFWMTSGDPEFEKVYKDFGLRVVPLPATEMLTSLQTGMIDAISAPPLFALLDRSFQIADNMLDINWGALNAATIIDAETWSRIPAELRPRLMEAARREGVAMRDVGRKAGEDAVREMEKRGLNVVHPSDDERAQWRAEAAKAYPGLRDRICPAGLYDEVMRADREFRTGRKP